jgi:hypothetical protein
MREAETRDLEVQRVVVDNEHGAAGRHRGREGAKGRFAWLLRQVQDELGGDQVVG